MRPVILLSLVAIVLALCVGGGLLWNQALWRTGWFRGVPAVAKGLPAQAGTVSGPWSSRLRQTFPVGSAETKLVRTLEGQGFTVDARSRKAAYGWAVYPCVYTLTVAWRGDELGRVRDIQGGLMNACTDPAKLIPDRPLRRGRPANPAGFRAPLVPAGQSA